MDSLNHKISLSNRRRNRVRSKLNGSKERPRLSVRISLSHVYAQLIDDQTSTTLIYASTVGRKVEGSLSERAAVVGKELAKQAQKKGIKKVVFDRGSKLYHGRVKALADAAREGGLEF